MGIGDRLKEERERLGLSQTEFAALAGASKNTQYNYEKGERSPDANYLSAAAEHGVDVLFVLTGRPSPRAADSLTTDEASFVKLLRSMADSDRGILRRTAEAFAKARP